MASIKDLYTRDECNTPIQMTVGSETIDLLGVDSDAFIKAKTDASRKILAGELSADDAGNYLIASLIAAWSFDEECNIDNKMALVKNSPSLANRIDIEASKRANFTQRLKAASSSTQKTTSISKSQRPKIQK